MGGDRHHYINSKSCLRDFLAHTTSTTQNSGSWSLLPTPLLLKYRTWNTFLTKTNTLLVSFHYQNHCTPHSFLSTSPKVTHQEMVFLQFVNSYHLRSLPLSLTPSEFLLDSQLAFWCIAANSCCQGHPCFPWHLSCWMSSCSDLPRLPSSFGREDPHLILNVR